MTEGVGRMIYKPMEGYKRLQDVIFDHMDKVKTAGIYALGIAGTILSTGLDQNGHFSLSRPAMAQDQVAALETKPRDNLRNYGWEVYDAPGLTDKPDRTYQSKILPKDLRDNMSDLGSILSQDEMIAIGQLLDGDNNNDELKFAFVTADDYLALTIQSHDTAIGTDGIYLLYRPIGKSNADRLRKISYAIR